MYRFLFVDVTRGVDDSNDVCNLSMQTILFRPSVVLFMQAPVVTNVSSIKVSCLDIYTFKHYEKCQLSNSRYQIIMTMMLQSEFLCCISWVQFAIRLFSVESCMLASSTSCLTKSVCTIAGISTHVISY